MIPSDYDSAARWLAGGRKKNDRPMYWHGMRLQTRGNDIAAYSQWLQTDLALYHPDNSMTIQAPTVSSHWGTWDSLKSQGVRYALTAISGVFNIYQKDYKHYVVPRDAVVSPSKIQGCRTCASSGKVDWYCSPTNCWDVVTNESGKRVCPTHPEATVNMYRTWHHADCEHGKQGHVLYKVAQCWYCAGSGKREYGLKRIPIKWDGSPLRLKDGKLFVRELTELEKRIASYVKPIT